jgi:copper chaperone CopZ
MNIKRTLTATLISACVATATQAAEKSPVTVNATNRFSITGMHCDGCAGGLTAELKETRGVASAVVTFSNKLAVVAYDTNLVNPAQLTKAIKDAGFTAKPIKP